MQSVGCRVKGLRCRVQGVGCRVQGAGLTVIGWISASSARISIVLVEGLGVEGLDFRVSGFGFRA